jgi:D-alanyl-D-alanine carboxypeptidase
MALASSVVHGLRYGLFGLVAVGGLTIATKPATARNHDIDHKVRNHDIGHKARAAHTSPSAPADSSSPLGSSIVVDGNTGLTLEASKPNALRHPASLTKIMTLYLLFERIEQRTIGLDSQLKVSENAASQAPTKLGLKAGQIITVEDAIKAMVTNSANDAAVAVAENLGGDEGEFAKLMTNKAHALGMSHTTYVNASGLPDDNQITTAQDQALLGRAIQERFPRYYKYFSTKEFVYRGTAMSNHNHLLGVVGGVDGIKTGYTRSSGFNLVTSVHRDGHYIVAVVFGGHTASERDARMRELIDAHIRDASLRRTVPAIAEKPEAVPSPSSERVEARSEPKPIVSSKASEASSSPRAILASSGMIGNAVPATGGDPIQALLVKTITYRPVPDRAAAAATSLTAEALPYAGD